MCGISGIIYQDSLRPVSKDLLSRMTSVLSHRGPDGGAVASFGHVGFGHRRLKIIDLTENGRQPMSSADGKVHITFNGEIYNYPELRHELEQKGHVFRSQTDTEVILIGYRQWGISGCLQKLNGMFAFAIWDQTSRVLHLVRDRLGIKPLFYYLSSEGMSFASEIKSILQNPAVGRDVDLLALDDYLSLNYCMAPRSMFANIRQLLPGERLEYKNGEPSLFTYWDLQFPRKGESYDLGEHHYLQHLHTQLLESVRAHLVSDVPVGAFLSGGIDSSTIVLYMRHLLNKERIDTFSIGFGESSYDEIPYARKVVKAVGTNHHEHIIVPDAIGILPKIVWHAEEPTADSSMIPIYYLSQMAKKNVSVVLSGDGADELFAGYETYSAFYLAKLYRNFPDWLKSKVVSKIVNALPISDGKLSWEMKLKRFVRAAAMPPARSHFSWRIIFDQDLKKSLYSTSLYSNLNTNDPANRYSPIFQDSSTSDLAKLLYSDMKFYLPNNMLIKVDRMSMAHGLEVRVPFLDHRLVELAAQIPDHYKLKYGIQKKYLIKKMIADKLPNEIWKRKKAGFNVPIGRWLRNELNSLIKKQLLEGSLRRTGWFDSLFIENMIQAHQNKQRDYSHQLWGLLVLSIWHEQFIDQPKVQQLSQPLGELKI